MNTAPAARTGGGTPAPAASLQAWGCPYDAPSPNGHITCHRAPNAGDGHVWQCEWCADRREREVAA